MNPQPFDPLATRTSATTVIAMNDLALARSAIAGEKRAADELMSRLSCVPRMVSAQNAELGRPLDATTLDDVTQEVLVLVWKKLATFEGRATLESWTFRICQLEVLAQVRRRRRVGAIADADLAAAAASSAAASSVVDRDVIALERAMRLLEELPEESQRVVRMKHFDSLTFEEIALRLAISPSTAKSLYYRALLRLRQRFQDVDLAAMGAT